MGAVLGVDGKKRALEVNAGVTVPNISTLYIGLINGTLPAGADGMALSVLAPTYEFGVSSSFYSGRKPFTFGTVTADANGAIASYSGTKVSWQNLSGATKTVGGYFITDASSGSSGKVLWVGSPDAGTITLIDTGIIEFISGDIAVKVD